MIQYGESVSAVPEIILMWDGKYLLSLRRSHNYADLFVDLSTLSMFQTINQNVD
jgi:hypothetical protein